MKNIWDDVLTCNIENGTAAFNIAPPAVWLPAQNFIATSLALSLLGVVLCVRYIYIYTHMYSIRPVVGPAGRFLVRNTLHYER